MQRDLTPEVSGADARLAPVVAIGILAWNEESTIGKAIDSLFRQTLFARLNDAGGCAEVFCVVNGSTDQTAAAAARHFEQQRSRHPHRRAFTAHVVELTERGKGNAWNRFAHSLSSREARVLILMDADIEIHEPDTLWNLLRALEHDSQAVLAVDHPCKNLQFRARRSPWHRLSLAVSSLTRSADAQLCGQLYAIRSSWARNIFMPRDLTACEDGFIKTVVCTDFLTRPVRSGRLVRVAGAGHIFEAYTSPVDILRNQKRQAIGQTVVHVLVDEYLKQRPVPERLRLADTLRRNQAQAPDWLKHLVQDHVRQSRFFWRLYPGVVGQRFRILRRLSPGRRLAGLPAAMAGTALSLLAAFLASRALREGLTSYWPHARRPQSESGGFADRASPSVGVREPGDWRPSMTPVVHRMR